MGSAKSGTHHHWLMIVTACALVPLVVLFVFTFGAALGGTYEEVIARYSRPWPAFVALATVVVGLYHFKLGSESLIEDYTGGLARKALLIGSTLLCYGAMVLGALSIIRLAL